MAKPIPIILMEDDLKVTAQIADILRDRYELLACEKTSSLYDLAKDRPNCLTIIDFDLKEIDGIAVFKKLKEQNPHARAVMISSSNNIPLAVSATKLGVLDFLRKPLIAADLLAIVEKLAKEEDLPVFSCEGVLGAEWLNGSGQKLKELKKDILKNGASSKSLIILAEPGIDKAAAARLVHVNGLNASKKMVLIDLSFYAKESLESHFWATINELLSPQAGEGVQKEEEQPGVIFIDNIGAISDHFRLSLFDYLNKKLAGEVKVILGAGDPNYLKQLNNFEALHIPPLRERKEDLPAILASYLGPAAVSGEVLEFISYYDFPGNYEELKDLVNAALSGGEKVNSFIFNKSIFSSYIRPLAAVKTLASVREIFEKKLIALVFNKTGGSIHSTARFLNLPKTVLEERMRNLDL